jgi:DNA gyrase/topoisomerase IV subunit A
MSYDGRRAEPNNLPVKFPLLLLQAQRNCSGTFYKVLPHNFNELIDASIKILKGNRSEFILILWRKVLPMCLIIMMDYVVVEYGASQDRADG